jgi:hypothetical protein
MKSVKVDGSIRITGTTVVAKHGRTVLLNDAEVHLLTVKNVTKQPMEVSYPINRKRVKYTLQPKKSVDIEIPALTAEGLQVDFGDNYLELYPNEVDSSDAQTCPVCRNVLEPDDEGYCPNCEGE